MAIVNLIAAVPPPKKPIDAKGDWAAVHAELWLDYRYMDYPADFREFIARYGSGRLFEGYLEVYNPLTPTGLAGIRQELDCLRIARGGPFALPLEVHPTCPGLLPWGHDENGNTYCWLTREQRRLNGPSESSKWQVVFVGHGHADKPEHFRADFTTFLSRYATNKYPKVLPGGQRFADKDRIFTPGRSQAEVYQNMKSR